MEKTPKKWQKVRIFDTYQDANDLRSVLLDNDDTGLLEIRVRRCGPRGSQFKVKKYFDIPINNWKLENLAPSITRATKLCLDINQTKS